MLALSIYFWMKAIFHKLQGGCLLLNKWNYLISDIARYSYLVCRLMENAYIYIDLARSIAIYVYPYIYILIITGTGRSTGNY